MMTPIYHIARKILFAYNTYCKPILEKYNLHQVSFDILMFLYNNPEHMIAQEISEMRHIKKNLVSVHVEKLVSARLLERHFSSSDKRKIELLYTEKAMPIIQDGIVMQKEFYKKVLCGISDEHYFILNEIIEKINFNVEEIIIKNGGLKNND